MTNPYAPGIPGSNYQPQTAIIQRVEDAAGRRENLAVTGWPKTGKSSLLIHLKDRLDRAVLIEPDALEQLTPQAFFKALGEALPDGFDLDLKFLAKEPYGAFLNALDGGEEPQGPPCTLLIDDADVLFASAACARLPEHLSHLLCRHQRGSAAFRAVFAHQPSQDPVPDPLRSALAQLYLEPLSPDQTRDLARLHMDEKTLTPEAVDYLYLQTRGAPYQATGALAYLWEKAAPKLPPASLGPEDVHDALDAFRRDRRMPPLDPFDPKDPERSNAR